MEIENENISKDKKNKKEKKEKQSKRKYKETKEYKNKANDSFNVNNNKKNDFYFDLNEERNELLQMANLKKLQDAPEIKVNFQKYTNKINDYNSNEDNNNISNNNQPYSPSYEVNEILEQFFRRQIKGADL